MGLLFLGLNSVNLSRNLTLLVCRLVNLWEYPLFLRLVCVWLQTYKRSQYKSLCISISLSLPWPLLCSLGGKVGLGVNVCLFVGGFDVSF